MAEKEAKLTLRIKQFGAEALETVKDGLVNIGKVALTAGAAMLAATVKGLSAYKEQELAVNRLNQAMVNNGDFTAEASKDLQAFASQLQKTSTFGDETIISMLSLAKSFGVSNEQAKKMIQAAADLSAATGMSLESAVKNLGKSLAGMTGELGESVPALRSLTAEQLKSGAAIDMVAEKFKGSTQATITGLGAIDQLKNSLGDFLEIIGKAFAPFVSLLAQGLNDMTNKTAEAETTLSSLNSVADFTAKTFVVLKNLVVGFSEILGTGLAAAIESVTLATQLQFSKAKDVIALGMDEVGTLVTERSQTLSDELDMIDQVREQQSVDRLAREEQMLATSQSNKLAIVKKSNQDMTKELIKQGLEEAKRYKEKEAAEWAFQKTKVDIISAASNLITTIAGRDNKVAFLLGKAAAIAQSIVATNLAATQAYAASIIPGDPSSPIRAAAISANVRAAGMINTATIAATAIQGLADGGIVKARPGGIIANIGEGGQDEAVIPLEKSGMLGNTTININGPVLGDQAQAKEFAIEIDRQLMMLRRNNESVAFDSSLA